MEKQWKKDFSKLINNSVYGKKNTLYKTSSWDEKEAKRLFRKLPFYDTIIEKPNITKVKSLDLLSELLFYEELNILKR